MCLTVIGMVLTLTTGTSGSNSSPDYSLTNLILMGVYVAATLALVGISIWQARAALTASAKQSQDAIDAVNKQITASEAQSNAAIDAVNKQIAASERQAQEALYNQHRPVLVPVGGLGNIIETSNGKPHIKWGYQNPVIDGLRNIGVGPAFNIYGILFGPPYISTPPTPPTERYVVWNYTSLSSGQEGDKITLQQFTKISSETTIGEYPLYVPDDVDHISIIARFTLTYHDVLGRKHASIYDYHAQYGWRSRGHFPNIDYDIRELDRKTPETQQAEQFWILAGKRAQS